MSTPRRTFLSFLGLGAVSASLPEMLGAETAHGLKPVNDKWNLSWTKRVSGKCRAVFDVQALIDDPVARATMWRSQYAQVFGIDESKLTAVVVVRHVGIPQVMNDAFWDEFNIGRPAGRGAAAGDSTAAASATSKSKGNPGSRAVATFISKGGIVLACDLAFGNMVSKFRGKGLSTDDARKQAIEHLIPGVILQPSGPFAVMRAQDEGCHYMMAS